MRRILIFLFVAHTFTSFGQMHEDKSLCRLNCEYTEADRLNAELIYLQLHNDSIKALTSDLKVKQVPLRFAIVQKDSIDSSVSKILLIKTIDNLNATFKDVGFKFHLEQTDLIVSTVSIEDLSENSFNLYDSFSKKNDLDNMLTVYVLDHKKEFCETSPEGWLSCGRVGGFSYILSDRTNNIVISRFDLEDPKIVAHEFGHFFGLYHTFEEQISGKDTFDLAECHLTGDRICDTPPDPGTLYEVYVNYFNCEMVGLQDDNKNDYKPLISNVMSYYKPCYLKEYEFTPQQIELMKIASTLNIRKKFFR